MLSLYLSSFAGLLVIVSVCVLAIYIDRVDNDDA